MPARGTRVASRRLLYAAEHLDVGKEARRRRVADVDCLVRLALAAGRRAEHLERVAVPDYAQAAPEIRRHAAVVRVLPHAGDAPVLDHLAPLAAELELVARVVDRPR